MAKMATPEEISSICEHCDKDFKDALTLKRHISVQHTQEEPHICDHCGMVFNSKYLLGTHLASKHGINDQYQCDKCDKYLMSEGSFIKHKRKCSTLPCPVCGKEFKKKSKLQDHVDGHLNNKRHVCDECGKDFLHSRNLVEHIEIVHQGKRPFHCDSCSQTFTRKGSLRTHMLVHTGIKSFPCILCEQIFREKRRLITHLQSRHNVEENEIPNYVKLKPKKEIVKKEDTQRVLEEVRTIITEPKKLKPIKLNNIVNENTENVCSSEVKDYEHCIFGSNNTFPPQGANNHKDYIEKKEDDWDNTIKQECNSENEDESDKSERDIDEAYRNTKSIKHDEELSKDVGELSNDEDKSWSNIPVEAIIKYEHESTDNDEDNSQKNSINLDTKSRIKCPLNCGITFKDRLVAKQHLRRIHKFDLSEATKIFPKIKAEVKRTSPKIKSVEKATCPQCHQIFLNQSRLDIHVAYYHVIGEYICTKCGETFNLKGKFKKHVFSQHTQPMNSGSPEGKAYPCEFCGKRFRDALTLKRHTNVQHTRKETHVCDHCGTVFYTKYKLDTHLASKHGINNQYKCDKCNQYLMSEGSLFKHKINCSAFPCPVCGKEFIAKSKMQKHLNGHLNNKRHMCDDCGKDFLHAANLVDHIEIVHQGKRPFHCDSCPQTFTRKGSLRVHKLIHAGIKSFPCTLCKQCFTEKRQLITHLQRTHNVEDNELPNYVKLMPKKEILKKEDAMRVIQAIHNIETEPVQVENMHIMGSP